DQTSNLRNRNARSYYRWLQDIIQRTDSRVSYTKGHTGGNTLDSRLNSDADYYASKAQFISSSLPTAPIPTFAMNDYTFYREGDGWIESNMRIFVDQLLIQRTSRRLAIGHKQRMATWLYDNNSPPPYIYLKATSAYTALIQLYARSGQLPTAVCINEKKKGGEKLCRRGCDEFEDDHHIFVTCPLFAKLREEAGEEITRKVKNLGFERGVNEKEIVTLLEKVKFFFKDSQEFWPLG
ncbi:hypothetical protein BDQ12DRAFT_575082, partial [Crucibulum laeve]